MRFKKKSDQHIEGPTNDIPKKIICPMSAIKLDPIPENQIILGKLGNPRSWPTRYVPGDNFISLYTLTKPSKRA
jgi:hypothetical protein